LPLRARGEVKNVPLKCKTNFNFYVPIAICVPTKKIKWKNGKFIGSLLGMSDTNAGADVMISKIFSTKNLAK
jgi:hypothetical protein